MLWLSNLGEGLRKQKFTLVWVISGRKENSIIA